MNRLAAALIAYAVLGVLTWLTISDTRIRAVPLGILVLFAVKSVLRRNDVMHADGEQDTDDAESRTGREGHDFSRATGAQLDERL